MASFMRARVGGQALFAVWISLLFAPWSGHARTANDQLHAAVDAAIAAVRPALVRIQVISTEYQEGRELKRQTVGSGAIITKDGYLVTNHHVAGHGARMICTLSDREEIPAELVGTDPLTDIAVLKLKGAPDRKFKAAAFGDSSTIRVGDSVLAMGSPMALSQSVTLGIISNSEMIMPRFFGAMREFRLDGEDVGSLVRWIGHDAAIYGGNSGGPLVNLRGEIVGINEISFGLSGAIPGNLARQVAEQIMRDGKVRRSWLGLDVQPLFKHSNGERGVLVSGVIEDSPASLAGLQAGDLLLKIGGEATNVRYDEQMPDFMRLVTSLPLGRKTTATYMRAGKEMKTEITPIERGELWPKQRELKEWGLTVRNITYLSAREMKRTNTLGVFVSSVRPGGPAGDAKPNLDRGDVLMQVEGKPVGNVTELIEVTTALLKGKTDPVPVVATFDRESRQYLTVIRIGLQELRDPGLEVTKAWLPVETQVISRDIAAQRGDPTLKGFYITQVYPDTAAARAGLRPGDFIVSVDDEKMTATGIEHDDELSALIRQYEVGAKVELGILRGKEKLKVPVELARSPKTKREMKKYQNAEFEFSGRDISFFDRAEEQWEAGQKGVLIEEVKPGGWAELGSVYVDDLLLEVDGQPVPDVDTLRRIMETIVKEQKTFVVMKVLRGIHTAFLELEPAWKR